MLNHEASNASTEDISQLNQSETSTEAQSFNPEAAKRERAIAFLDKFIADIESSEDYGPDIEYQTPHDISLAASTTIKKLNKSAIDYSFETMGLKYDETLYSFVGADEPNYSDEEDYNYDEKRREKILEALNSGSLSQDESFGVYPMSEGFKAFYVRYALDDFKNATYTADFLTDDKNSPISMTTAVAKLIRDDLKNNRTEKDDKKEISLDDVFPVKDEHFQEKVDAWKTEHDVRLGDFEEDDRNRCYLEIYKKFGGKYMGDNRGSMTGLSKEKLLDILSEHDDHPELLEKLGLSDEQKGRLAQSLIGDRVDFMAKDMLQNPEKFVDFVKKYATEHHVQGLSETPEGFVLPRYKLYHYCKRVINGKGTCIDFSDEVNLNKIPDECKNNIETILKNMEENFDIGGYDPTKAFGFREEEDYYVWNGYLATESDHDLHPEYPLELCDKEALEKLKFRDSYDEDYKIVDNRLVFVGDKNSK